MAHPTFASSIPQTHSEIEIEVENQRSPRATSEGASSSSTTANFGSYPKGLVARRGSRSNIVVLIVIFIWDAQSGTRFIFGAFYLKLAINL
jgi:hypothetical protein